MTSGRPNLAVIRLKAPKTEFPFNRLADPDALKISQPVYAIGHASGQGAWTVTYQPGALSGIETLHLKVQSPLIQQGYSGGVLIDGRKMATGMVLDTDGTTAGILRIDRAIEILRREFGLPVQLARNNPSASPAKADPNERDTGQVYKAADVDPELPSGEALLLDGNTHYDESGFSFGKRTNVAWGSGQADILFAGSRLFTQNNAGDSPGVMENAPADLNAHAGLQVSPSQSLGGACPLDGYVTHWFPRVPSDPTLKQKAYYCLRLRDGTHYAKIKITNIEPDRIAFVWVYQPSGSRNFR